MYEGLLKKATGVWFRPQGIPFTIAGAPDYQERLTGMTKWAPRKMVERVGKGLETGTDIDTLAQKEKSKGLLSAAGTGGAIGAVSGGVLGRLLKGEAATAPFKELLSKGMSRKTLKGLSKIPFAAKALPVAGLGAGLLAGAAGWGAGGEQREGQTRDVARGLLAERVLQRNALKGAIQPEAAYSQPLLRGLPSETASVQTPYAVTLSNTGL